MTGIDTKQFPLFARLNGALFQGMNRSFKSEADVPVYLLDFAQERELGALLSELRQIAARNMGDAEWESYWYGSSAYSFPRDGASSNRLIEMLIEKILQRQKSNDAKYS